MYTLPSRCAVECNLEFVVSANFLVVGCYQKTVRNLRGKLLTEITREPILPDYYTRNTLPGLWGFVTRKLTRAGIN